jgi:RNA polymerase sigma-70 factor, ECF subfamily
MPIRSYEIDLDAVDERLAAADSGLGAALASLPDSQRNALELRVVGDLPYRDVAGVLGCTETAARIRVMRALDRLARLLGAACA